MSRPLLIALVLVSGCARLMPAALSPQPGQAPDRPAPPEEVAAVVVAPPPPAGARTAEQFDTTTAEQRAAATAAAAAPETELGRIVVSLGDPTEGGLWLKTELVEQGRAGRIVTADGADALVELIPAEGGGRLSLAAMRLLNLPLTDLPTVTVYGR